VRMYGELGAERAIRRAQGARARSPDGRLYVGDAGFRTCSIFDKRRPTTAAASFSANGRRCRGAQPACRRDDRLRPTCSISALRRPALQYRVPDIVVSQFGPNKVDVFGYGKNGRHGNIVRRGPGSQIGRQAWPLRRSGGHSAMEATVSRALTGAATSSPARFRVRHPEAESRGERSPPAPRPRARRWWHPRGGRYCCAGYAG